MTWSGRWCRNPEVDEDRLGQVRDEDGDEIRRTHRAALEDRSGRSPSTRGSRRAPCRARWPAHSRFTVRRWRPCAGRHRRDRSTRRRRRRPRIRRKAHRSTAVVPVDVSAASSTRSNATALIEHAAAEGHDQPDHAPADREARADERRRSPATTRRGVPNRMRRPSVAPVGPRGSRPLRGRRAVRCRREPRSCRTRARAGRRAGGWRTTSCRGRSGSSCRVSSGEVGPNVRVIDPSALVASGSRVLFLLGYGWPVCSSDRVWGS